MAFGVTPEGFKAKHLTDIMSELATSLNNELGIDINSSPDSVAKILTNIYALALSEEWALPQALQSMFDIDKAEGKHLDDLVGYQGIRRLSASPTTGNIYITADRSFVLTIDSSFRDNSGNQFVNPEEIAISQSNCVGTTLSTPTNTAVGVTLEVNINGILYIQTITTTAELAVSLLVQDINNNTTNNCTASYEVDGSDVLISLDATDDKTANNISGIANLTTVNITCFGRINNVVDGPISVAANTVTTPPPISFIESVTNRYALTTGRSEETDEELRARHLETLRTAGGATVEAIIADLLDVAGVSSVDILENTTLTTDAQGIPGKAFEVIIKGGSEQDIANSLWLSKPAGIETHGETTVEVINSQGDPVYVSFSRPIQRYIHANVTYSEYSEEAGELPSDAEDQMRNIIVNYGNALDVGEDVIPQRFASQIFQNIGGLATVDIEVGATTSPDDPTPPLSPAVLPISPTQEANFDGARITFVKV